MFKEIMSPDTEQKKNRKNSIKTNLDYKCTFTDKSVSHFNSKLIFFLRQSKGKSQTRLEHNTVDEN